MVKLGSILFLDSTHPILPEKLQKMGFTIDYDFSSSKEEIINKISNYQGVIIRSRLKLDKNILKPAKNLKFIGRVGSGLENIDTDYAHSKGIFCLNSPEGNRDSVGEHTLGLLLAITNNIVKSNNEVKNGFWFREENRGMEINGKTIAIIGYGNMGSAFVQRLSGFKANVIAYDKYKFGFGNKLVNETSMEEIFKTADIISFHIPYTEETHYLLNRDFLSKFEKNIIILNTSRGKIVNTDDLVDALKSKKVIAAGLDVIEYESTSLQNKPISYWSESMQYIANAENVILTPHIAGWSNESNIKLSEVLFDKIVQIINT